jgi:hypothetical protein
VLYWGPVGVAGDVTVGGIVDAAAGACAATAIGGAAASRPQGQAQRLWQEHLEVLNKSHKKVDDVKLYKDAPSYPIVQTVEAFAKKNSSHTLRYVFRGGTLVLICPLLYLLVIHPSCFLWSTFLSSTVR